MTYQVGDFAIAIKNSLGIARVTKDFVEVVTYDGEVFYNDNPRCYIHTGEHAGKTYWFKNDDLIPCKFI